MSSDESSDWVLLTQKFFPSDVTDNSIYLNLSPKPKNNKLHVYTIRWECGEKSKNLEARGYSLTKALKKIRLRMKEFGDDEYDKWMAMSNVQIFVEVIADSTGRRESLNDFDFTLENQILIGIFEPVRQPLAKQIIAAGATQLTRNSYHYNVMKNGGTILIHPSFTMPQYEKKSMAHAAPPTFALDCLNNPVTAEGKERAGVARDDWVTPSRWYDAALFERHNWMVESKGSAGTRTERSRPDKHSLVATYYHCVALLKLLRAKNQESLARAVSQHLTTCLMAYLIGAPHAGFWFALKRSPYPSKEVLEKVGFPTSLPFVKTHKDSVPGGFRTYYSGSFAFIDGFGLLNPSDTAQADLQKEYYVVDRLVAEVSLFQGVEPTLGVPYISKRPGIFFTDSGSPVTYDETSRDTLRKLLALAKPTGLSDPDNLFVVINSDARAHYVKSRALEDAPNYLLRIKPLAPYFTSPPFAMDNPLFSHTGDTLLKMGTRSYLRIVGWRKADLIHAVFVRIFPDWALRVQAATKEKSHKRLRTLLVEFIDGHYGDVQAFFATAHRTLTLDAWFEWLSTRINLPGYGYVQSNGPRPRCWIQIRDDADSVYKLYEKVLDVIDKKRQPDKYGYPAVSDDMTAIKCSLIYFSNEEQRLWRSFSTDDDNDAMDVEEPPNHYDAILRLAQTMASRGGPAGGNNDGSINLKEMIDTVSLWRVSAKKALLEFKNPLRFEIKPLRSVDRSVDDNPFWIFLDPEIQAKLDGQDDLASVSTRNIAEAWAYDAEDSLPFENLVASRKFLDSLNAFLIDNRQTFSEFVSKGETEAEKLNLSLALCDPLFAIFIALLGSKTTEIFEIKRLVEQILADGITAPLYRDENGAPTLVQSFEKLSAFREISRAVQHLIQLHPKFKANNDAVNRLTEILRKLLAFDVAPVFHDTEAQVHYAVSRQMPTMLDSSGQNYLREQIGVRPANAFPSIRAVSNDALNEAAIEQEIDEILGQNSRFLASIQKLPSSLDEDLPLDGDGQRFVQSMAEQQLGYRDDPVANARRIELLPYDPLDEMDLESRVKPQSKRSKAPAEGTASLLKAQAAASASADNIALEPPPPPPMKSKKRPREEDDDDSEMREGYPPKAPRVEPPTETNPERLSPSIETPQPRRDFKLKMSETLKKIREAKEIERMEALRKGGVLPLHLPEEREQMKRDAIKDEIKAQTALPSNTSGEKTKAALQVSNTPAVVVQTGPDAKLPTPNGSSVSVIVSSDQAEPMQIDNFEVEDLEGNVVPSVPPTVNEVRQRLAAEIRLSPYPLLNEQLFNALVKDDARLEQLLLNQQRDGLIRANAAFDQFYTAAFPIVLLLNASLRHTVDNKRDAEKLFQEVGYDGLREKVTDLFSNLPFVEYLFTTAEEALYDLMLAVVATPAAEWLPSTAMIDAFLQRLMQREMPAYNVSVDDWKRQFARFQDLFRRRDESGTRVDYKDLRAAIPTHRAIRKDTEVQQQLVDLANTIETVIQSSPKPDPRTYQDAPDKSSILSKAYDRELLTLLLRAVSRQWSRFEKPEKKEELLKDSIFLALLADTRDLRKKRIEKDENEVGNSYDASARRNFDLRDQIMIKVKDDLGNSSLTSFILLTLFGSAVQVDIDKAMIDWIYMTFTSMPSNKEVKLKLKEEKERINLDPLLKLLATSANPAELLQRFYNDKKISDKSPLRAFFNHVF